MKPLSPSYSFIAPAFALSLLTLCGPAHAQTPGTAPSAFSSSEGAPFPLWPAGKAPGVLGDRPQDTPTITPFLPTNYPLGPRPAMVICPGGG